METDEPNKRKVPRIHIAAFHEFEQMFIAWMDNNTEALAYGHPGDVKGLAQLCAAWAAEYLTD